MNGILNFFIGYSEYLCDEENAGQVLSLLIENNIPFFGEYSDGEKVHFCVPEKYVKSIPLSEKCKKINTEGFLYRLGKYKNRAGIAAGALFCVFFVWFSSNFVWDIVVEDKENEEKILAILEEAGLKTGVYIPSANEEIIEIKALLNTDEFSYISVTFDGTVAYIQTEKRTAGVIPDDSTSPSNLVADADGVIVRYEVYSGDGMCLVGQTVEKGQLLISGFDETRHNGTRVVRAKGAVYAEVEEEFSVCCPMEITEKVYTGRTYTRKKISICGLEYNYGKIEDFALCDAQTSKRKATVFGKITLPVYITETVYHEYELQNRVLSEEQAEHRAKMMYLKKLDEVSMGDILYRDVKKTYTGCEVRISCTLGMVKNIAKEERIGLPLGFHSEG